jgi:hypothetical protein
MHPRRLLFLYALTPWIAFVAIRIEILNADAGTLLPRLNKALAQNRADGGSGKWRAMRMDEARWLSFYHRDADGNPDPRPLTPEEHARMTAEIHHANASLRLRDFVHTLGILQYPAVFIACLTGGAWTLEQLRRRRPALATAYALPTLHALLAGALAVYRGYFSSMITGV